jgi:hypothetical protein
MLDTFSMIGSGVLGVGALALFLATLRIGRRSAEDGSINNQKH